MKIENMILLILACFLIFISMSCICACDDLDVANTRDADSIIVDDAIDDSINVIVDGGSSADDSINVIVDGGSSADDSVDVVDDVIIAVDGSTDSIDVVDGDSIIKKMTNNVPKYNDEPISNIQEGGNSFGDVQKLINDLPAGSVLYLYKDYTVQNGESSITMSKDITINGNGHTINARENVIIFQISGANVALKNLKLTNGKAVVNGGAIYVQSAVSLECDNVTFSYNYAGNSGGAVHIDSKSPATFIACTFLSNHAHKYGGAIFTRGILNCIDCAFTDNLGDKQGGAIKSESIVNCTNCKFDENRAKDSSGGGIFTNSSLTCTNCSFNKNNAATLGAIFANKALAENSTFEDNIARCGGAIYTTGECRVKNSVFKKNSAYCPMSQPLAIAYGGAIYSVGWIAVEGCKFYDNTAGDRGGAIFGENAASIEWDSEFIGNEAHDFGGAIYALDYVNVNCGNWKDEGRSIFKSNKASSDFGGAILSETEVFVGNVIFDSNFAEDHGGAIFSYGKVDVNRYGNCVCTFKSNRANSDSGGAIYSLGLTYVANSVFDSNFAEDDGGAIYSAENIYVNWIDGGQSIFKCNRANTDDGGAIYSKANVLVRNAVFSDGYAHDGGAIFAEGNTVISSSNFTDNYASHQGGAIYEKAGIALRELTYFTGNGAKDSGGAIYTRKFDEDVYHATFKNNRAGDDGGAIYIDHENHETFTECDFEGNYAGDEGGAIYLDDGDSHLSLIRNNLVNNNAKSGYTVYNHGNYDDIKDNWHGSSSPNFDNQFKKYRLILKDKVITPSSYAKTRISW